MPLFDKVAYHISDSIPEHLRREIGRILDANGAAEVPPNSATHVVSDTIDFEGANTLKKDAVCVTPYWVERSMALGTLQDPKYFSADKEMIFSGVVATSAGIPPGDKEVIIAGIKESGGQWREGLTRDVTHLFVTNTSSQKYETAMHFRSSAHITILLPQWFDQCWSMQMRLPHEVFEFPDPVYMRNDHDPAAYKAQMPMNKQAYGPDKHAVFRTIKQVDKSSPAHASPAARDIWQGRAILLSSSLALDAQRRESVEARIRRNGGAVVASDEDETTAIDRADVLVTQYRTGAAYVRALSTGKTIGTLAWLFYVERSGVVSSPRDQLLHYPVRNRPIEGFADHEITVTNYQGDEREYLKKLIEIMGAKFTPTMSGRNTIVIAAYKSGIKTAKADEWSVPVVTHKWLEDCFVEWRNLTPAQKKYLDYAPGVNYGTVLGERGVGRVGLEGDPELPPEKENVRGKKGSDAREDAGKTHKPAEETPRRSKKRSGGAVEGFTATSARDAREVAEVEDVLNLGDDIERADDVLPPGEQPEAFTPKKVGPPRGAERIPGKTHSTVEPKPKSTSELASTRKPNEDVRSPPWKEKGKETPLLDDENNPDEKSPAKSKPLSRTRPVNKDKDSATAKSPVPARPKPKPKPRSAFSTKRDAEGSGTENNEHNAQTISVTARARPKPKPETRPAEEGSGIDEDDVFVKKKPALRKVPPALVDEDDDEEDVPRSNLKPKSRPGKEKAREPIPIDSDSDSDEEMRSRVEETPPRIVGKSTPKTYRSKAKSKAKSKTTTARVPDPESEDSVQEVPTKRRDRGGKSRPVTMLPSPTRIVSVELPDPRSILGSIKSQTHARKPERKDLEAGSKSTSSPAKPSPTKQKPPPRTTSIRAAAYEAPFVETPKRGRPAERHESEESLSASPSPAPMKAKLAVEPVSDDSGSSQIPQIQRTPSRRTAAAAATQRLRDEVMPDVINYENEIKRGVRNAGRRRKTSSTVKIDDDEDKDSDSEGEARVKKKRKVSSSGKGKNKESGTPPAKFVTHVRSHKRTAPTDDEEESKASEPNGRPETRKKFHLDPSVSVYESGGEQGQRLSSCDPKKIRILTTKVTVREEVCKPLVKLGVKFTEKPEQCTHLVASSFARTEKFLCALSNAPFVLTISWILESSARKVILAESDYYLKDPSMEKKHNFKLMEALERARELKAKKEKLFQGRFFYFTPNVSIDFSLMKNVIQANGAECIQKTPTVRNLSSTRHVISSSTDEKLWRPLAKQGFPIYSPELILTAACAQFVDWDGDNKRVEGSVEMSLAL